MKLAQNLKIMQCNTRFLPVPMNACCQIRISIENGQNALKLRMSDQICRLLHMQDMILDCRHRGVMIST
jgi:hypothetical protein